MSEPPDIHELPSRRIEDRRRGLRMVINEIADLEVTASTEQDQADLEVLRAALEILTARISPARRWMAVGDRVQEWARDLTEPWTIREAAWEVGCHQHTAAKHVTQLIAEGKVVPEDPTLPKTSTRWRYMWNGER